MMDQNLIDKIDELTKRNTEYMRDTNVMLNHIRGGITKSSKNTEEEAYNRGLNDAWDLAGKVDIPSSEGGYALEDLRYIFGEACVSNIYRKFTGVEAMHMVKEFEERLKEAYAEVQSFKRGNVVSYDMGGSIFEGIFLYEDEEDYLVISPASGTPQQLSKRIFTLTKTGAHVDIDKNLRVVKKE